MSTGPDYRPGAGAGTDARFQAYTYAADGADHGHVDGATHHADASIGSLLKELAHEVPALLRNEVALARSEMRDNLRDTGKAVGEIATGGAVAVAGLVVLLMAGVYALSEVMAPWLAALLVGAGALLVGYMMLAAGKRKLDSESLRPERSMESLRKDRNIVRGGTQ